LHGKDINANQEYSDLSILIDLIWNSLTLRRFRQTYRTRRLCQDYDIANISVDSGDIRIVVLWGTDGSANHAVSVVNNWIFDGNCSNALKLNTVSLNDCCGVQADYAGLRRAYHCERRPRTGIV
jgi:hypothetical protein